jgi:hypothetical protein
MKRFHVHVAVRDLQESTRFYSAMFGVAPTVVKPDYAKWMLEDPKLNFAISQRSQTPASTILGSRPRALKSWKGIHANLQQADHSIVAEKGVHCCYAKSDKYWVTDPQGIAWESFARSATFQSSANRITPRRRRRVGAKEKPVAVPRLQQPSSRVFWPSRMLERKSASS